MHTKSKRCVYWTELIEVRRSRFRPQEVKSVNMVEGKRGGRLNGF